MADATKKINPKTSPILSENDLREMEALLKPQDRSVPFEMVCPPTIKLAESQPRKHFDSEALANLKESIKVHGLMQPLVVRRIEGGRTYKFELIAGERRLRACIELGLQEIPVHVVDVDDKGRKELALIENLNREDLNPIEETEAILGILELATQLERVPLVETIKRISYLHKKGHTGMSSEEKLIEAKFEELGRFTVRSFETNRLSALERLAPDLYDAVRVGRLEYSKANVLNALKDDAMRADLLMRVLRDNLSRQDIQREIRALKDQAKKPVFESAYEQMDLVSKSVNEIYMVARDLNLWNNQEAAEIILRAVVELQALKPKAAVGE